LIVAQIPTEIYTSNIYKITIDNDVWFVDIGNGEPALKSVASFERVKGVFITHSHYDHIHGINDLYHANNNCKIFASEYAIEGLYSEKLNLSFYHENPIVFKGKQVEIIKDNDLISIGKNFDLRCIYTPGHNAGSMSFQVGNYLFTGDSFIPQIPVVTKLKSGDKQQNVLSLQKIKSLIKSDTIVCPGHGSMCLGEEIIW
jgi:glyoxylase-like metal-dependent hydrolase (beta-lactamase superfamily II)